MGSSLKKSGIELVSKELMERYFEFWGRDCDAGWIFRVETDVGLQWRRYDICDDCHAIDLSVLSAGIESDTKLQIRAGADVVYSDQEGLTLVSERTKQFIEKEQIAGIGFIPLPKNPFYVVHPVCFVDPTPIAFQELEFEERCLKCEKSSAVYGQYTVDCFVPLKDENTFFGINGFNIGNRICDLLCSESVAKRLKAAKLKGLVVKEIRA